MLQTYMTAIDRSNTSVDDITDGLNFEIDRLCLLISNHRILKGERVYFELTIDDYNRQSNIVHIPMYVGVHKDPASGLLVNDCSLGTLYYKAGEDYSILENDRNIAGFSMSNPESITAPTITTKDIVGVAIDSVNNKITIYNNGIVLYSWTPTALDLSTDEERFYACIYVNIAGANIKGSVNFGRYSVKYLPDGFTTIFDMHNSYPDPKVKYRFDPIIVKNKTNGELWIDSSSINRVYSPINGEADKCTFTMDSVTGNYAVTNLPVPYSQPIYTEFRMKNGVNANRVVGIPVSIGLTTNKKNLTDMSVRIPLWHDTNNYYKFYWTKYNVEKSKYILSVYTSIPNIEGNIVGVLTDIKNRLITVWVNKILFYTYIIPDEIVNNKDMYLYFLYDGSYKSTSADFYVNLGCGKALNEAFNNILPYGSMSLWYYYNRMFVVSVPPQDILDNIFYAVAIDRNIANDMFCEFDVSWNPNEQQQKFKYGLNRLMSTYNTVTDVKPHHDEPRHISILKFNQEIAKHNYGYYPDYPKGINNKYINFIINCQFNVTI